MCPESGDGRDVDDGSAAALFHVGYRGPAGENHAFHVDRYDTVPVVLANVHHRSPHGHPHVVIQDIEAPISLHGCVRHRLTIIAAGHVALEHRGLSPLFLNHPLRLLSPLQRRVNQQNPGSLPGEQQRCRFPVANARTAGPRSSHNGYFAFQSRSFGHRLTPSIFG